jgi:hypothetical protein
MNQQLDVDRMIFVYTQNKICRPLTKFLSCFAVCAKNSFAHCKKNNGAKYAVTIFQGLLNFMDSNNVHLYFTDHRNVQNMFLQMPRNVSNHKNLRINCIGSIHFTSPGIANIISQTYELGLPLFSCSRMPDDTINVMASHPIFKFDTSQNEIIGCLLANFPMDIYTDVLVAILKNEMIVSSDLIPFFTVENRVINMASKQFNETDMRCACEFLKSFLLKFYPNCSCVLMENMYKVAMVHRDPNQRDLILKETCMLDDCKCCLNDIFGEPLHTRLKKMLNTTEQSISYSKSSSITKNYNIQKLTIKESMFISHAIVITQSEMFTEELRNSIKLN